MSTAPRRAFLSPAPTTTTRISGVDVARGLAVLGMFAAHVGFTPLPFSWGDPSSWLDVVNGRSAILFALLAGVSIAIISGRQQPPEGTELVRARVRILVRAVLIFGIGGLLDYFGTTIAVVLPAYAAMFVLALPFLRWRPRSLFIAAGSVAVVMPVLFALILPFAPRPLLFPGGGAAVELLIKGHYPALLWMAFVLAGLGLGRLDLAAIGVQVRMLVAGTALAVAGYGLGSLGRPVAEPETGVIDLPALVTTAAHSGSPFEVVGSGGFAMAVLALALLVTRASVVRAALYPVRAVGRMALTAYSVHVVAIAAIGVGFSKYQNNGPLLDFIVAALVACSLWTYLRGAGPLEWLITWVSRRAAGTGRADSLDAVSTDQPRSSQ